MFDSPDRTLPWLRENEVDVDSDNEPYRTWIIPTGPNTGRRIQQRDFVILDQNNNFLAVQNLSATPLENPANRLNLTNLIRSFASITDTDIDGVPDQWELDFNLTTDNAADDITLSGQPLLLSYALSANPRRFTPSAQPVQGVTTIDGETYRTYSFRRRLAGEGLRLLYEPQVSSDFVTWSSDGLVEISAVNLFDGTGTEMVTVRENTPVGDPSEPTELYYRLRITVPLF